MYRNAGKGGSVLICIVPLRCLFYLTSLAVYLGASGVEIEVGGGERDLFRWGSGVGWGGGGQVAGIQYELSQVRTSSIYYFRECLLYLVCCPFSNTFCLFFLFFLKDMCE